MPVAPSDRQLWAQSGLLRSSALGAHLGMETSLHDRPHHGIKKSVVLTSKPKSHKRVLIVDRLTKYNEQTDNHKGDGKLVNTVLWQLSKFRYQNRHSKKCKCCSSLTCAPKARVAMPSLQKARSRGLELSNVLYSAAFSGATVIKYRITAVNIIHSASVIVCFSSEPSITLRANRDDRTRAPQPSRLWRKLAQQML